LQSIPSSKIWTLLLEKYDSRWWLLRFRQYHRCGYGDWFIKKAIEYGTTRKQSIIKREIKTVTKVIEWEFNIKCRDDDEWESNEVENGAESNNKWGKWK
jgi:hypothetical protein